MYLVSSAIHVLKFLCTNYNVCFRCHVVLCPRFDATWHVFKVFVKSKASQVKCHLFVSCYFQQCMRSIKYQYEKISCVILQESGVWCHVAKVNCNFLSFQGQLLCGNHILRTMIDALISKCEFLWLLCHVWSLWCQVKESFVFNNELRLESSLSCNYCVLSNKSLGQMPTVITLCGKCHALKVFQHWPLFKC